MSIVAIRESGGGGVMADASNGAAVGLTGGVRVTGIEHFVFNRHLWGPLTIQWLSRFRVVLLILYIYLVQYVSMYGWL